MGRGNPPMFFQAGKIEVVRSILERSPIEFPSRAAWHSLCMIFGGSSSPLGDHTEAEAIYYVFKDNLSNMYINATKGLTGHCLYSAGLVEAVATVLQMNQGFLHPNINLETPIRDDLQFCGAMAMDYETHIAISNSFGFGGINTSIVLKK